MLNLSQASNAVLTLNSLLKFYLSQQESKDEEKYYAGPNHPALGELVESELYYNKIVSCLDSRTSHKGALLCVSVARGCLSKVIGQRKYNKQRLIREYGLVDLKFKEDGSLSGYELKIEEERKRECT